MLKRKKYRQNYNLLLIRLLWKICYKISEKLICFSTIHIVYVELNIIIINIKYRTDCHVEWH